MRKFEIIEKYKDKAILPTRATKGSAGYDFHIIVEDETRIGAHEVKVFPTGIKAKFPNDEVLLLFIRSSIGIKGGLTLANSVPIIDSDFYNNKDNEGHIMIALRNETNEKIWLKPCTYRVAQGIFMRYVVTDDDETHGERIGGIGST